MITLPAMSAGQAASWHALMALHEQLPRNWVLVGGQMVHLHCAERDHFPDRATDDADAVVDVRADPQMLSRFTAALAGLGFVADTSGEGLQHRWVCGEAQVDVLLPDGVGEKAAARHGVGGAPTLETPGGSQALARSESVEVLVEGRHGSVVRPTLVGALVMKAAAHTAVGDAGRGRHRRDFATLASLVAARDLRGADLRPKDRKRLRAMIAAVRGDESVMARPDLGSDLERLERGAKLVE